MSQTGCSAEGLEAYALRVIGNSMEPEFQDGHIIIVDPGFPLLNGVYAVIQNGEEIIFGQYFQEASGCWIRHLNPEFEDIALETGFVVKGIITQRNGRKRKDIKRYDYSTDPSPAPEVTNF